MNTHTACMEMSRALVEAHQGFTEESVELVDFRECVVQRNWDHSHYVRLTTVHLEGRRDEDEEVEVVKWQGLPQLLSLIGRT